jgi:hypothetical protein
MKNKNMAVLVFLLVIIGVFTFRSQEQAPPEDIKRYLAEVDQLHERAARAAEAFQRNLSTSVNPWEGEEESLLLIVERLPAFNSALQSIFRDIKELKVPQGAEAHYEALYTISEIDVVAGKTTEESMEITMKIKDGGLSDEETNKLMDEQYQMTIEVGKAQRRSKELRGVLQLERAALEAQFSIQSDPETIDAPNDSTDSATNTTESSS